MLALAGSALAGARVASFKATGALKLSVTKSPLCIPTGSGAARRLSFGASNAPNISVIIDEFQTGLVNTATTHDDLVIVQQTGSKPEMWVAGWSGASTPGHPSPQGSDYGNGTLEITNATGSAGHLSLQMPPAPKSLDPGNEASTAIHLTASWSC